MYVKAINFIRGNNFAEIIGESHNYYYHLIDLLLLYIQWTLSYLGLKYSAIQTKYNDCSIRVLSLNCLFYQSI